ncbi:hypothetical protein SMG44B_20061 [Stenotrophomonas maltophilia]
MPVLRDTHNGIGAPAQFQPMTNTVLCTLTRGERTRKHHDSTRSMPLLAGPCPSLNNGNAKHTEDFRRSEPRTQPCAGGSRPGERHRPPCHCCLFPRPTLAQKRLRIWPGQCLSRIRGTTAQGIWTRVKVRAEQCGAPAWCGIRRCLENNGEHHGGDPYPRTQHESDCQMSADSLLESGKRKLDVVEHHPTASGVGLLAHLSM